MCEKFTDPADCETHIRSALHLDLRALITQVRSKMYG